MSTTPITETELINASTDAEDFGEVVNSTESKDVTTRLGAVIPTLVKAIRDIGFSGAAAWLTATVYTDFKTLITEAGNTYILVVPHTSGVFATDLTAGKWELYHPGGLGSAAFVDLTTSGSPGAGEAWSTDDLANGQFSPAEINATIGSGTAQNATTVQLFLPMNMLTDVTTATIISTFQLFDATLGAAVATGIASASMSLIATSNGRMARIQITGLAGLVVGDTYYLLTETNTSSIVIS